MESSPRVHCTQWGGQTPPNCLKWVVTGGCQSRVKKMATRSALNSWMYRLIIGMIVSLQ